jgi:Uma2 family endonuclease
MASKPRTMPAGDNTYDYRMEYPTSDGRPMGETDLHRQIMMDLIETLKLFYKAKQVYVSGNLLICYRPGDGRKHVAPDVFVVKDIDPHARDNYLLWEERKGPDVVIEITSKSTRKEDTKLKYELYRDVLKVVEYFLFDPRREFLDPPLQGFRLANTRYVPIQPVNGRLPSYELSLHLEQGDGELKLWNPASRTWIPTPAEAYKRADTARQQAEAELERLRREIEEIRMRRSTS